MSNKIKKSQEYWEKRYKKGGNSGKGSYGKLAEFKSNVLNKFIKKHNISSVLECGCGDGNQLEKLVVNRYIGLDVSQTIIDKCKTKFIKDKSKTFDIINRFKFGETAVDCTLSLDVIYHLVEDKVYFSHLENLFSCSNEYVIIYAFNFEDDGTFAAHVRPRNFSKDVRKLYPNWKEVKHIPNKFPKDKNNKGSHASFFIFKKQN
jgi:SAM-dependent methyltransferase